MLRASRRLPLLRLASAKVGWGASVRSVTTLEKLNLSDVLSSPSFADNIAVLDENRNLSLTYTQLNEAAAHFAATIESEINTRSYTAIGAFNEPGIPFVVAMLATWKLGKTFVSMSVTHSQSELDYVTEDSGVGLVCCASKTGINEHFLQHTKLPVLETENLVRTAANNALTDVELIDCARHLRGEDSIEGNVGAGSGALVIYTSGTTGKPKGVLHTHGSLFHMTNSLVESWRYTSHDKILHFLPLYHVHGLVNKLLCVLYAGGTVEFTGTAAAPALWKRLAAEDQRYQAYQRDPTTNAGYKPLTLFMAVPTIYARMLEAANDLKKTDPTALSEAVGALKRMRLMVCGSAALPDTVLLNWQKLTGYKLLERYGMTEIGMALSNPYDGERRQGSVGFPLPGVECRLVDDHEQLIAAPNTPGELRIKGPQVFSHYLNKPEATKDTFDREGWFKTGDVAEISANGYYKILGRSSADIIKSSGYKLSALEIERELLSHPQVLEAAVVGAPDATLGEKVVAVIALRHGPQSESVASDGSKVTEVDFEHARDLLSLRNDAAGLLRALRDFLQDKLAPYKQPREYIVVDSIPRNHMGKVNKKGLLTTLNTVTRRVEN